MLLFAAMPTLGNPAGGILAEALRPTRWALNLALRAAAGIVVAVVELTPQGHQGRPAVAIVLAFVLGGVFYVAVGAGVQKIGERLGGGGQGGGAGPYVILFGVSVDLFSDGVLIGTGSWVPKRVKVAGRRSSSWAASPCSP